MLKVMSVQPEISNRKGFTLIELMITISIIAIISTVGIISYSKAQQLGRDAKRKQDLQGIQKALSLYYNDFGSYPKLSSPPAGCSDIGGDLYCYSSNSNSPWIPSLTTNYANSLPKDPLANKGDPNSSTTYGYGYMSAVGMCPSSTDAQYYMLFTHLENPSDPDRLAVNDKKICPQATNTLYQQGFSLAPLYVITN